MSIEFSNKWYRETCLEAGLNPDNMLSDSEVEVARMIAKDIRKYQIAQKNYPDPKVQEKLEAEIKRLHEKRIEHMLNALNFAEMVKGLGKGFDEFIKRNFERRNRLLRRH